jgi:hypothetical protein
MSELEDWSHFGLEDGGRPLEIALQYTGGPSVDREFWKLYSDCAVLICMVADEFWRGISGIIEVLSSYSSGGTF